MANRCAYYPGTWNVTQHNSLQNGGSGNYLNHPQDSYPSPTSTTYTPTTPTVHRPPTLVRLEQHQYGHVVPGHLVEFGTLNGEPINLLNALNNELEDLENKNEPAFPSYMDVKAKASIRIQISGIASYTRQFMSLRSNKDATSISRGKLVQTIAKEVKKMIRGDVLRVPGVGDFPMEEIYLTKIGVHPALQVASSWCATSRRRRKAIPLPMDQQRVARSITANYWHCADTVSPFSSRGRRCGVGRRSRSRGRCGVGRPSMRRIELSWFPSFLATLYHALGQFFPVSGASLAYTKDRVTPFCTIQWRTNIPSLLQFFMLAIYSL